MCIRDSNNRAWLSTPYLIWIIGFTVIPMAVIFRYALSSPEGGFTLANVAAIADPVHLKAVIFSLEIAVGCTLICILSVSYTHLDVYKRQKWNSATESCFWKCAIRCFFLIYRGRKTFMRESSPGLISRRERTSRCGNRSYKMI